MEYNLKILTYWITSVKTLPIEKYLFKFSKVVVIKEANGARILLASPTFTHLADELPLVPAKAKRPHLLVLPQNSQRLKQCRLYFY